MKIHVKPHRHGLTASAGANSLTDLVLPTIRNSKSFWILIHTFNPTISFIWNGFNQHEWEDGMDNDTSSRSRRDFIKKLAYIPPAIATLNVIPAFASSGSGFFTPNASTASANTSTASTSVKKVTKKPRKVSARRRKPRRR